MVCFFFHYLQVFTNWYFFIGLCHPQWTHTRMPGATMQRGRDRCVGQMTLAAVWPMVCFSSFIFLLTFVIFIVSFTTNANTNARCYDAAGEIGYMQWPVVCFLFFVFFTNLYYFLVSFATNATAGSYISKADDKCFFFTHNVSLGNYWLTFLQISLDYDSELSKWPSRME